MAGALDGVRVIDLTVWFQGPVSAQYLADFGAEVIKVERPQGGDQGRGVRSIKALPVGDWNQYFLVINRNKKSVALDLKKPEGQEVMYRMVKEADVFLSNLGTPLLESWNLSYEKLSAINPKLVYATNTGYGYFGDVVKPSFDMTVQALTGIMARMGEPGQPPIYLGMGSGDAYGGIMSAMGIVMALYQRNRTGQGQKLDASLYGAQLFLAAPALQAYLATKSTKYSHQRSRKDVKNPLWNLYPAKDKWVYVCMANEDANWQKLAQAVGDVSLASDARFATVTQRRDNARALIDALDAKFATRAAEEWMQRLTDFGVAAGPINNLQDCANDAGAWENQYFLNAYCEEVKREVKVRGLPVTLSKTPGKVESLGPELGQDTEIFLMTTLGYSWEEIEELKAKGAIP